MTMHFDVVTIFPEYLEPLKLSLVGKAIDDERIRGHLDRVVRGTVEETLNALLDAEADRLCNAQRYERTEARRDTRAGHYERNLETKGNPPVSTAGATVFCLALERGEGALR